MDFITDGLATGRMVRILSVVDAYTRECLALEVDTSFASRRVTRVLEQIVEERRAGPPVAEDENWGLVDTGAGDAVAVHPVLHTTEQGRP